jgi:micrococcal nuclease
MKSTVAEASIRRVFQSGSQAMAYGTVTQFRRTRRRHDPRRRIRPRLPWIPVPLMLLVGAAAAFWIGAEVRTETPVETSLQTNFAVCHGPARHRYNCVVDGDTIYLRGERIRIADIDAPELFSPQCEWEAELARRSTRRLVELINEGEFHTVRYGTRDRDHYGRKLRVLERDGRSLGGILVSEGLAQPWAGARRSWCG